MRPLALALCLLAGCRSADPCSGHDGTCLGLEIKGSGVSTLDQLRFSLTVAGLTSPLTASSPATPGRPVTLPTRTALYFAAGVSGAAQVAVEGELAGTAVAAGTTTAVLVAGRHSEGVITLEPLSLGGDGAIADLSTPTDLSRDLAGVDLATSDLATLADLNGADLLASSCPGDVFCDDFEGEDTSFGRWNGGDSVGTMQSFALDDTHPFLHGSQSLEVTSAGSTFYLHKLFSAVSGSLAVRFYFYASSMSGVGATLLHLGDGVTDLELGLTGSGSLDWRLDSGGAEASGGGVTLNSWRCVELDLDLVLSTFALHDEPASAPHDGDAPVLMGSFTTAPFNVLDLGIYGAPTTGDADVWFDDVVVGSGRIGCE